MPRGWEDMSPEDVGSVDHENSCVNCGSLSFQAAQPLGISNFLMKGETLHFAQHDIKAGASVEKRFRDVLRL